MVGAPMWLSAGNASSYRLICAVNTGLSGTDGEHTPKLINGQEYLYGKVSLRNLRALGIIILLHVYSICSAQSCPPFLFGFSEL